MGLNYEILYWFFIGTTIYYTSKFGKILIRYFDPSKQGILSRNCINYTIALMAIFRIIETLDSANWIIWLLMIDMIIGLIATSTKNGEIMFPTE